MKIFNKIKLLKNNILDQSNIFNNNNKILNNLSNNINFSELSFKDTNINHQSNIINTLLFLFWGIHEFNLINNYNINNHYLVESVFHIMTLIWQYVGLFIISHDLHHNENPGIYENILGRLSLLCYGGFLLEDFSKKHSEHHKYPGNHKKDPDFFDGNIIFWYLNFMIEYINFKQVIIQLSIYNILKYFEISDEKMILFWLVPSVLASIQLFFYGTYLVHEKDGKIKNSNLPKWLITFTSYNFGNHINHHKYPKIPWFKLK